MIGSILPGIIQPIKRYTNTIFFVVLFFITSSSRANQYPDKVRVFIGYEQGSKPLVQAMLQQRGAQFHYAFDQLNTFVVTLPGEAMGHMRSNPFVLRVEQDPRREVFSEPLSNLPVRNLYPVTGSQGQSVPYGVDAVQARDIWDQDRDGVVDAGAATGAGRVVCIIDSGYFADHEDLPDQSVVSGYSQISGEEWWEDGHGHGTHVAGTIAGLNNDIGILGVTPGTVSLYIVKVFDANGDWTFSSDLIAAANRCADNGADVISMSLGGAFQSSSEELAFQQLYDQGILSIAAAGNDGSGSFSYPASYPAVVSVAAVDENNLVAGFSQKNNQVELAAPGVGVLSTIPLQESVRLTVNGEVFNGNHIEYAARGTASGQLVDGGLCSSTGSWNGKIVLCERGSITFFEKVANVQTSGGAAAVIYNNAPGNFLGTLGDGNTSTIPAISLTQEDGQYLVGNKLGAVGDLESLDQPGSGYEAWNGTSMATPHVSAVAALVWSADPSWTNVEIREALQQTALDLGAAGRDSSYGFGLVQAYEALQFLEGEKPKPTSTPTLTNTPTDTPTYTPTMTNTPTDTPTSTPTKTETPAPTSSSTNTASPTATDTPTPTMTPSATPKTTTISSGEEFLIYLPTVKK